MCMTFCAGLYEVYTLEQKLKTKKKEVCTEDYMKTNVGLSD